jgi:selenocysteine lyase/cysteine desulfurase
LEWVEVAQAAGWDVLLDCAAFAPTNKLDLGRWRPDFVPLSFYKIFGYPTGVGCLIAKRAKLAKLRRPWFAGGTITIASVQGEGWHYLIDGEAAFEDGTVNYLNLPAVEIGLRHIEQIGIERIHARVSALIGWLLDHLQSLRHSNGAPMIRLYGPGDRTSRGSNIAFNFFDPDGLPVDYRHTESLANDARISLRTGCFCNPGAGEIAHNVTRKEMAQCFTGTESVSFAQFFKLIQEIGGKSASTIRISLGIASNFADVYRFMHFAQGFRDRRANEFGPLPTSVAQPASERDTA